MNLKDFDPTLYLVTDTRLCAERGVVETVRQAVDGGVSCVQVRAKDLSTTDFLALVISVADAVGHRVPVIIDDRVDIYLAARHRGAAVHGVHVGQSDLPIDIVRALVGPEAIVGWTTNTADHLELAAGLAAGTVNYLGVGVIRATTTKPDHPAPIGIDGFERLSRLTALPCIAIGGITEGDVAALRRVGAAGVAVVSAICAAEDPRAVAIFFRREWDHAE